MKKKQLIVAIQATIFSVGIGSASSILAEVAPSPPGGGTNQPLPPSDGSTQPAPAPDSGTSQPLPPSDGSTQPAPAPDSGTSQPLPPSDGSTQPAPASDSGTSQPLPPSDGSTQPAPAPDSGTSQPLPPSDGSTQPAPAPDSGTSQPLPPSDGLTQPAPDSGTSQPLPPSDGSTQPAPAPDSGTSQPLPPSDGSTQPVPNNGTGQPQPPSDGSTQPLPALQGGLNPKAPEFDPTEFQAAHVGNLEDANIPSLTADHLKQFSPTAMGGFKSSQVANFTPEAVKGLDSDHVANLAPEAMGGLNKEHVANMPPASAAGFSKEQVANMPPASLSGLTAEHVANMPPESFSGLTAEHVANMPPESRAGLTADQVANTPPEAMAGLTKEHIANTPPEAIKGITPEQFTYLPKEAMKGVTPEQVAVAPPEFFGRLTKEDMPYVNQEGFAQTAGYDKARILANLNPEEFTMEDMTSVMPSDWKIDDDGTMRPPSGIVLALPFKKLPDTLPTRLKMPNVSDLSKGFGLGGMAPKNVLQELEQGLAEAQLSEFDLTQDENGILNVKGTGGYEGTHLAFIPDNRGMMQGPEDSPPGLSLTEDGKYVVISPDGREIPVIPAPKNPEGVLDVLPEGSEVEMTEDGNVLMNTGDETLSSVFDPLVQSGGDNAPGFHHLHKTHGILVYEDGTAQNVNASFRSPDAFLEEAAKFPGVTEVEHNAVDGTVNIKYDNAPLRLKPWLAVEKTDETGPKIELTEESSESEGIELVFTDESGYRQIFSAVEATEE